MLLALPHQGHCKLASQPHRPRSLTLVTQPLISVISNCNAPDKFLSLPQRPSVGIRATRQHQWPQRSSPMPSRTTTTSILPPLSEIHPAVPSHMLFSEELGINSPFARLKFAEHLNGSFIYASAARLVAIKFIATMSASAVISFCRRICVLI